MTSSPKQPQRGAAPGTPTLPPVVVKVPRQDRLAAIGSLARAVEKLAGALHETPSITVQHCTVVADRKHPAFKFEFE